MGEQNQHQCCWYTGSLHHLVTSSFGIEYAEWASLSLPWGRISITYIISELKNYGKCKYNFYISWNEFGTTRIDLALPIGYVTSRIHWRCLHIYLHQLHRFVHHGQWDHLRDLRQKIRKSLMWVKRWRWNIKLKYMGDTRTFNEPEIPVTQIWQQVETRGPFY